MDIIISIITQLKIEVVHFQSKISMRYMKLIQVMRRCHYYTSYSENRFSAILRRFSHNRLK